MSFTRLWTRSPGEGLAKTRPRSVNGKRLCQARPSPGPLVVGRRPGWEDLADSSVRGGKADDRSKHDHSEWEEVVLAARVRARSRQALMVERFGLSGDVQYHWSMDDAQITWSREYGNADSGEEGRS